MRLSWYCFWGANKNDIYSSFVIIKRVDKKRKMCDIYCMNEFLRGMATIGELSPPPVTFDEYPPNHSGWQWVANSFAQAGFNMWVAMKEFSKNTYLERKQAE
jgi:hypothetical protein